MVIRKWIASGHGPAMLVALLLSLIAGAPAAASPGSPSRAASLEQGSSQQAVVVKRTHSLQALRAPQPTPFSAVIPDAIGYTAPRPPVATLPVFEFAKTYPAYGRRDPQQPRAPPAN